MEECIACCILEKYFYIKGSTDLYNERKRYVYAYVN